MSGSLRRGFAVLCAGQGLVLLCAAEAAENGAPSHLNSLISQHARANGVPEDLVHKVVRSESAYNARAYHRGNYGLMQIRYGTARALGYTGPPSGLLDANTNLTYGVRYLAGAYRVAGGIASRAMAFYRRGYYYALRRLRRGRQETLTAEAPQPAPTPVLSSPVPGPVLSLFALPVSPSVPQLVQPAGQVAAPLVAPAAQPAAGGTIRTADAAQPSRPAAPHPAAAQPSASELTRPVSQSAGQTVTQPAVQAAAQPTHASAAARPKRQASERARLAGKAVPPRAD